MPKQIVVLMSAEFFGQKLYTPYDSVEEAIAGYQRIVEKTTEHNPSAGSSFQVGYFDEDGEFVPVQDLVPVKLARRVFLKISAKGHLTYSYSYGMPFEFTLLSEVSRLFRPVYLSYFKRKGYEIETIKLEQSPWLQDVIKNFQQPS